LPTISRMSTPPTSSDRGLIRMRGSHGPVNEPRSAHCSIPDLSKEETSPTTVRQAGAAQRGVLSQSRLILFLRARGLLHNWLHSWLVFSCGGRALYLFVYFRVAARWLLRAGLTCVASELVRAARVAATWTRFSSAQGRLRAGGQVSS
jgi:hypothetical protein